jgi:hypothetical protein
MSTSIIADLANLSVAIVGLVVVVGAAALSFLLNTARD